MSTRSINTFNLRSSTSTGGLTGSTRVADINDSSIFYQLKSSILDNSNLIRRVKAKNTDREIFGEIIVSVIARKIFENIKTEGKIPQVELIYDAQRKKVLIASKYIKGNIKEIPARTLDEYIKQQFGIILDKAHARFVTGDQCVDGNIGLNHPCMQPLKSSLYDVTALSAAVGDHDINPGNMLVTTDLTVDDKGNSQQKSSVARIDFGHALNDLLNAPALFGGTLLNPEHPIIDFINRDKIAGIKCGAPSKLWRDYPGICSPEEMADFSKSLEKIGGVGDSIIKEGAEEAETIFVNISADMNQNDDIKGIQHIQKTLVEIYNNISSEKISPATTSEERKQQLDQIFDRVAVFVTKNCADALYTANLMQVQSTVYDSLKKGHL